MNKTFTVTVPRTYTFLEGWGVEVTHIHAGEDWTDPDAVVDMDTVVVRIDESTVVVHYGTPCVRLSGHALAPVDIFEYERDDECESRWFATREEAEKYADEIDRRAAALRSWFDDAA